MTDYYRLSFLTLFFLVICVFDGCEGLQTYYMNRYVCYRFCKEPQFQICPIGWCSYSISSRFWFCTSSWFIAFVHKLFKTFDWNCRSHLPSRPMEPPSKKEVLPVMRRPDEWKDPWRRSKSPRRRPLLGSPPRGRRRHRPSGSSVSLSNSSR